MPGLHKGRCQRSWLAARQQERRKVFLAISALTDRKNAEIIYFFDLPTVFSIDGFKRTHRKFKLNWEFKLTKNSNHL